MARTTHPDRAALLQSSGIRLATALAYAEMTPREAGEVATVTASNICKALDGRTFLSIPALVRLAVALDVSLDWLLEMPD